MADDSLTPDKTNTKAEEQNPSGDGAEPDSEANTETGLEMADRTPPELTAVSSAGTIEEAGTEGQTPALPYPVVGFGASAGGLQAFRQVLEKLDPKTGMTFVLVMHLAPDQKSFLSEILERETRMQVSPAENGARPEPNRIYVLLPNQFLTLHDGFFKIEPRPEGDRFPKTIDRFFYSLAADQKNHAIGVVLSGADGDGALGLKAIKAEGGIALVQSPESATHTGMPRSSIAADHVDLVVPPAEIAAELARLGKQFARPAMRLLDQGEISADDEGSYQRILQLLKSRSGLDLRQYKQETIRRRVARRMLLLRMDELAEYLQFLQIRPDELKTLQEDVLINVTRFFRDPAIWDSLRTNVLPQLLQERPHERQIRIWCAGCSTGEEAYSLAISVLEYLSQNGIDSPVQVFGTDASERAIETARMAVYPETITHDVSPERLRKYFVKVDRGYQVSKRVRDTCIFARQNLANDPPFSHIDILSCRNVMIYFNSQLQRQVMLTFHYALEPGGYILLGTSEGLRDYGEVFRPVDRKNKVYAKTGSALPGQFETARHFSVITGTAVTSRVALAEAESGTWPELELQRAADRIVLARFGPPGLIVDHRMNVLQSRGQTAPFMEITPGTVSWSLMRVVKEALIADVRSTLQRAMQENVPASTITRFSNEQTGDQVVQIDVLPITSASPRPRCYLILFHTIERDEAQKSAEHSAQPLLTEDEKDRLIAHLRQDLTTTRFHLQSLVEERDAHNQELVSANEEIQSANEELQSTNEELETTKEELQSANEELQTVNDELHQRNDVLTQTSNDLTNLLNSVNIPLLMLTSDLYIRQFTPPMQKLLSVRPADIGRSINEIRLQLNIEDLEPILNEVLETLGTREVEVQDKEGRWYLLRVRPYRTADNKIEGLVIVLFDIDRMRKSEQSLTIARDYANAVVESVPVPIVVLNTDGTIRTENSAFRKVAQANHEALEGRIFADLVVRLWGLGKLEDKLNEVFKAAPGTSFEYEHTSSTADHRSLLMSGRIVQLDGSRVLLLVVRDITLQRDAESLGFSQRKGLQDDLDISSRALSRTQVELRGLNAYLFKVQEEERERVARELHDDISQRLSLLELLLNEVRLDEITDGSRDKILSARQQIGTLNTDVRQISHRLHPAIINDLGLSAALKALVSEFGERENMPTTYLTQNVPESWSPETATAIYRIAQEALRNIAKHAGKTHVKVVLCGEEDRLQLKVMDFGIGFDQEAETGTHGLGMISMKERARLAGGTLKVSSQLGEGTTVTVDVPVMQRA